MIPFGGFVKMHGDANAASTDYTKVTDENSAFYAKPLYARFLIIAAGPFANYLLAVIILACFYFTYGKMEMPAIIGEVMKESPAEIAGLKTGDKVIRVDRSKIANFNDLQRRIIMNPNQILDFQIDRAGVLTELSVTPIEKQIKDNEVQSKIGYIGIKAGASPSFIKVGIFKSIYLSIKEVKDISKLTLEALGQMLTGKRSSSELHGPITIARESGKSLSHSPLEFAIFIAMLSINLGLINLLPIPILDGGHLLFMVYEGVARKPLSKQLQNILLKFGMMVIVFLIVISISNDIKSLLF